jgi:hypothetical protein
MERPDGWQLLRDNAYQVAGLGDKILAGLADLPEAWKQSLASNPSSFLYRSDARAWYETDFLSLGFTAEQAVKMRNTALQYMSNDHPAEVLGMLDDSGLESGARTNLIQNIFRQVRGDEAKAAEWIALLSTEEDREAARSAAANSGQGSERQERLRTPDGWLEEVLAISVAEQSNDPAESSRLASRNYELSSTIRQWSSEQIAEMTERFGTMSEEEKAQVAGVLANRHGYSNEPRAAPLLGEALRYLVATEGPSDDDSRQGQDSLRLASQHAVNWVVADPAGARAWVQSLPEGDAKLWAQKNMAATWAQYDPDAAAAWVGSLPAASRAEVEAFVGGSE